MTKNFVHKVGVELEGGWNGQIRKRSPFSDITIHSDASIHEFPGVMHYGEIASPPMLPGDLETWIKAHYPEVHDTRCGFHVHVSVPNARIYALLARVEFYEYWKTRITNWAKTHFGKDPKHPIWPRLRGENKYCRMEFSPINQMRKKTKPPNDPERRTALNFCWGLHRTIENRVYPMFPEPDMAVLAAEEFIDCINTYLSKQERGRDFLAEFSLGPQDLD